MADGADIQPGLSRRRFLRYGAEAGLMVACVGAAAALAPGRAYLRPPGAAPDFSRMCIRCGTCVEVCSAHALAQLDLSLDFFNLGTPVVAFKQAGCVAWGTRSGESCMDSTDSVVCETAVASDARGSFDDQGQPVTVQEGPGMYVPAPDVSSPMVADPQSTNRRVPDRRAPGMRVTGDMFPYCSACMQACPTGALDLRYFQRRDRIGTAVIRPAGCTNCMVCFEVCPVAGAILFPNPAGEPFARHEEIPLRLKYENSRLKPFIDPALCVGCGRCAAVCLPGVIAVEPVIQRRKRT